MEPEKVEEKQATVWHIKPFDVEEIGLKNSDGNLSEYIRGLIRKDELEKQENILAEQKIKKVGILQIISYLFISTDLLVIAVVYFSSSLLVMAITIASGALLFLYSGIIITQRLVGEKKWT